MSYALKGAVDAHNSGKITVTDPAGLHFADVSKVNTLAVHQLTRLVGTAFVGTTVDTNFWTTATNGSGAAATQGAADMTLASGTANSGYANLTSVRKGRFIFVQPLLFRAAVTIPDLTEAAVTRRWGVYTSTGTPPAPVEGLYFEVSATGVLSVVSCTGGTPTPVASGSFNGDVTSYTLDTNVHAYEIHYFLMGVEFYIDGVLVHKLDATLVADDYVDDYTLPIQATSVNSASGTESGALVIHAASILRQGQLLTAPNSVYQAGTTAGLILKRGSGVLHSLALSGIVNNAALTLYDNVAASGTILWATGAMSANATPFSIDLHGVPFFTGLTLVIATANCNVTVIYE